MNLPPEQAVLVPASELRLFAAACLRTSGMSDDHARQLAELLVNSDLRGVRSHGTRTLAGYCNTLRSGHCNPNPKIEVVQETDVAVNIDGDGSLGYAPTMQATEMCIEKAKEKGIAVGAICAIGHYGSAGHYVRRAMEEGMIGFSVQGAYPQYYKSNEGKRAAHYGNPPLCFGLPSDSEAPVVLDGATCILADDQHGEEFIALEKMIPAALFKSMGYTAIGTALGGAFVGQGSSRAQQVAEAWPGARLGGMVWIMQAGLFTPETEFRKAIDEMVRCARDELIPVGNYNEATLPGAIEHGFEKKYGRDGIRMGTDDEARLRELGTELNIATPW
ncbi:MAG: Ldh family oxidoreductase [Candidatus Latescibacterota bacterium]|nr:Ldh family oxidoreductase [Candidatus Latescibacterota bacterium]